MTEQGPRCALMCLKKSTLLVMSHDDLTLL